MAGISAAEREVVETVRVHTVKKKKKKKKKKRIEEQNKIMNNEHQKKKVKLNISRKKAM